MVGIDKSKLARRHNSNTRESVTRHIELQKNVSTCPLSKAGQEKTFRLIMFDENNKIIKITHYPGNPDVVTRQWSAKAINRWHNSTEVEKRICTSAFQISPCFNDVRFLQYNTWPQTWPAPQLTIQLRVGIE